MKKLSLLLLLFTLVFTGCSDDDKDLIISNFESKLTEANSEFISNSKTVSGYYFTDTFQDNNKLLTFSHLYSYWDEAYQFAGFTYTNKTDNSAENSIAAITKKGKAGTTYLCAYTNDFSPSTFVITNSAYQLKGAWVTNSTYAYNAMTKGYSPARAFKKGDKFILTAIGYNKNNVETGKAEIYLADYKSDTDTPVSEWIWFDLTPLNDATRVEFQLSSTDSHEDWGSNTPSFFCIDAITLEEK